MAFRRGFKSQCERRAVEIRKDLGLSKFAPLNAFKLAEYLRIIVWSTKDIINLSPEDQANLISKDKESWSAITLRKGIHHLVVYKAEQSTYRTNSVVMHELSHIILGHELADVCISNDGSFAPSNFKQEQEEEANWLGGTLLLPRPLLLSIRQQKMGAQEIREKYGVSEDMLTWRVRMTGVDYQLKNAYQR